MSENNWRIVSSFENPSTVEILQPVEDCVTRAQKRVFRFQHGSDQALLVDLATLCAAAAAAACHFEPSFRLPIPSGDWVVIVSSPTHLEALISAAEQKQYKPRWLAIPPNRTPASGTPGIVAGRLSLAGQSFELRSLVELSAAERLRRAGPAQRILEGPDNLQRRGEWFKRKSGPAK